MVVSIDLIFCCGILNLNTCLPDTQAYIRIQLYILSSQYCTLPCERNRFNQNHPGTRQPCSFRFPLTSDKSWTTCIFSHMGLVFTDSQGMKNSVISLYLSKQSQNINNNLEATTNPPHQLWAKMINYIFPFIQKSGLSAWLAEELNALQYLEPWVINLILCYIATFATEVTSNTAICTLIMPIIGQLVSKIYWQRYVCHGTFFMFLFCWSTVGER